VAIPLRSMNTPSMATWTERGITAVAECKIKKGNGWVMARAYRLKPLVMVNQYTLNS
jgi:hypothetical protein